MAIDFKALGQKAAAAGADMTKAQQGGGDYAPPAEGPTRLRLVGYIELGKQKDSFQGKPRNRDKAVLIFELSGPKHPPVKLEDGTLVPHRIATTQTISRNEKSHFFKLFTRMNHAGTANHMAEFLDQRTGWKGRVVHRKYKDGQGQERIAAELFTKAEGWTIEPARYEVVDPETKEPTGEYAPLTIPPALSPMRCFLWDHADKDQWDSIFIDGSYPDRKDEKTGVTTPGRSKNKFQNAIKLAVNFTGSPIHAMLAAAGGKIDIPDAEDGRVDDAPETGEDEGDTRPPATVTEPTPTGQAADDALNGIV